MRSDAQRVVGYALYKDGRDAKLPYPLENFNSDVAGRSFHNGSFHSTDEGESCISSQVLVTLEQGTVTSLLEVKGTVKGVQYKTKSGQESTAYAPLTIIPPQLYDGFIAAIDNGNIKTQCLIEACQPLLIPPGALLMGDAFNMRQPLTGGGMTVALSDIVILGDLLRPLRDLNDASALCRYLETFNTLRKPVASTINTLAGALYKVFCASPEQARQEMHRACFDYLSLGGIFSNGPISLLSGLNPHPLILLLHFFAVAIYGVGHLCLPFPFP
ncbi:FAD/NAD(P)-binding oxidoreductase family protein [Actinidia rufa]|uniref:Squalene monooxygenase n=1 Tax=Actinidia rufa TaxID=165716 RepID=A0A7J0F9Z7_9ERIC|nr:FAD/NAD(P)-binding oxidoreductase family protein [Actinidia rufa]